MNKWYMHNAESIQENETHKILWDFKIERDHLISVNKNRQPTRKVDFIVRADNGVKNKESEKLGT